MVEVTFPDALCRVAKLPASRLRGEGVTLREVVHDICREHSDLKQNLFYDDGTIKEHFLLTSDRVLISPDQQLPADAKVAIMLAISGGMEAGLSDHMVDGLTDEEVSRYVRHIILPGVGRKGQVRLKHARVLVVGTGGLGSPVILYLAAAGVGTIGLIDFDVVDMSNLQRQIVHGSSTVGKLKVHSAKERLLDLNPHIRIEPHVGTLDADNALELIGHYDVVVDGSDNFACRYTVNDACTILKKPLVYGAVYRFEGQISVFNHNGGPCYRCLFPQCPPAELSPNCRAGGVIGVLPGIVGLIQATEAVKLIIGLGETLSGRLMRFDALAMRFDEITFMRRADCPDCSTARDQLQEGAERVGCASEDIYAPQIPPEKLISAVDLSRHLSDYVLLDVRDPNELEVCAIPGSRNIPLAELSNQLNKMDTDLPTCIICYSGARARTAARVLLDAGMNDVRVLDGGMKQWARDIEPTMPIY